MTTISGVTAAPARFRLRTFGTLRLVQSGDETVLGDHGHQRRRLGLLAVLAASGEHGRSRDQLLGLFWPETSQARARHSLDQLLYALRTSLDPGIFTAGNPVQLNAALIDSDVGDFSNAIARGELEQAIAVYRGPFLDGFYLSDAPEFERWMEAERARRERSYADALERLAKSLEDANDPSAVAPLLQKLIDIDPVSSKHALGLIRALTNAGDHMAALRYAERYEAIVARELGTSVEPAVSELVADVRARAQTDSIVVRVVPSRPVSRSIGGFSAPVRRAAEIQDPSDAAMSAGDPPPPRWAFWRGPASRYAVVAIVFAAVVVTGSQLRPRTVASVPAAGAPRPRGYPKNIAAYELYRRGSDRVLLRSDSGVRTAIELFQQAVALDSTYAAAWAGLARMYLRAASLPRLAADRERYDALGEAAARKAVKLDDSLSEAHAVLGGVGMEHLDFQLAEQQYGRAIALDPRSAPPHEYIVTLLLWTGRPVEALAHAHRALELDPLAPEAHAEVAHALLGNNRCEEALAELHPLETLRPPLLRVTPIAAQCYAREHRWADAIAILRPRAANGESAPLSQLGFMLARSDQRDEAQHIRAALLERWRRGEPAAYWMAVVSAGFDERQAACDWLERSLADHSLRPGPGGPNDVVIGPMFDDVRRDPCFEKLRKPLSIPAP